MAIDPYARFAHEVARLGQRQGMNTRPGWVDDIQTGQDGQMKVRAVVGYRPDGTPVKGPWLHFKGQKGTDRERRAPVKGQNVQIVAPNGDYQQAWLQAGPEAKHAPAPDHAETHGKEAYTFQNNDSRVTSKEGLHETWIAEENNKPPAHEGGTDMQKGGGSDSQNSQNQQSKQDPGKPLLKNVMDKESKAMAGCYKDIADYYVDEDLARVFYTKKNVVWVDKKGVWATKPIRIAPHPKDPHPRATKP